MGAILVLPNFGHETGENPVDCLRKGWNVMQRLKDAYVVFQFQFCEAI